jgi:hypothetical protein
VAVTGATLVADHPEFSDVWAAQPTMVTNMIAKAEDRCDSTVIGDDLIDQAVTWLACYFISTSPYARDKRVKAGVAEGYYAEYEMIARASGRAYRVIV